MSSQSSIGKAVRSLLPSLMGGVWGWVFILFLMSCSSDTAEYDPYHHWKSRNKTWFAAAADSAHAAISAAQQQYGSEWEAHCAWRAYKSLRRSPSYQSGNVEDSIFVHVLANGTGTVSPAANDTVSINFRGSLMPTVNAEGKNVETIFAQTYYGDFDPATAAPQTAVVNAFTEGFETALQYMVVGDDWLVYIPQELFYGDVEQGVIPAYSAACFRINLVKVKVQRP